MSSYFVIHFWWSKCWNRVWFVKEKVVHCQIIFPYPFESLNSDIRVKSYGQHTGAFWSHQIWWTKKLRSHIWDSILRSIFDNENIRIELNLWNTKLFIIESSFQIFLNHSILMSDSEVMIKTLKSHDHTKSEEPREKTQIPCLGKHFEAHFLQ